MGGRRRPLLGASCVLAAMALVACETAPTREQTGMVLGGIVGGVIGSELGDHSTAGTIIGTIAGAAVGRLVTREMDDQDRRRTAQALERQPTGRATHWVNPDTGVGYVVVPTRTYEHEAQPCREYTMEATIRGRPETVVGRACRQADGTWRAQP